VIRFGEIAKEVAMTRPGFVEHMVLVTEKEERLVSVVSLWRTKTEADHCHEEIFPSRLEKLIPLIDSGPTLQYFAAIVSDSAWLPSNGAVA
jgi:hypothetical protein